jgi:signal transduction histidine kinase
MGKNNGLCEVTVTDDGTGIDPAFLPHIFERFRQGDSRFGREHGGLGLGLAIARQIVEMHGGTITAESPGPGQGSTFRVRLPALP